MRIPLLHAGFLALLAIALLLPGATPARGLNGFALDGALVPIDDIHPGGPPRDGIPSIDHPKFLPATHARAPKPHERVLGVAIGEQARAYPIPILTWHEIVNDRVGDKRVLVTYCPLCGTGMVFAAQGAAESDFGVSGLLYNNDMLLYDRRTRSLWSQIMGRAVTGPLKGTPLEQLPAIHTTWADWRKRYPDTLVLGRDTGYARNYDQSPYLGYEHDPGVYFPLSRATPKNRHAKTLVLGVDVAGVKKAYPFDALARHGKTSFPDRIGAASVVVNWNAIAESAYVTDARGRPLPATTAYWFAWHAFWPDTLVWGE